MIPDNLPGFWWFSAEQQSSRQAVDVVGVFLN